MKCQKCKRKCGIMTIDCKYCQGKYCTTCITMETHQCKGIGEKVKDGKDLLREQLKFEPPRKIEPI